MKLLREIYDFITGGSIVAPAGLAVAIVLARILAGHISPSQLGGAFLGTLLLTFFASTLERAR